MLFDFITDNRETLIALARRKIAERSAPMPTERELTSGVPLFLDQLAETLRLPQQRPSIVSIESIEHTAGKRGAVLLEHGYTVAQVVYDYGDICQAVTELAVQRNAPITTDEFHVLNRCIDNAIAGAVTEYTRLRDRTKSDSETERSGVMAHELRNRVSAVQMAFLAIQSGRAPISGSVAAIVTRNLHGIVGIINRALVEVRLDSGHNIRQRVQVHQLIEDAEIDGSMAASIRGVSLGVVPVDPAIAIDADPQILAGALANLLQNAFKFTRPGGAIMLKTAVVSGQVEIEIEDECGGLPPGKAEALFGAFQQRGTNRSGLGLGLFISRKGVEANGGSIRVRDIPGRGCAFTISLPLMAAESS